MVNFGGTDRTSFVDLQEGMGPEIVKVCSQLMCIQFSKPKRDVRLTCVSAFAAVVSTRFWSDHNFELCCRTPCRFVHNHVCLDVLDFTSVGKVHVRLTRTFPMQHPTYLD